MITIVDKTKPPAPKYVRHEHPTSFRTSVEEKAYWDKEFQRWEEGYEVSSDGERITGKHYFHMQEVKIPTQQGGMIYPLWRDIDDEIFATIDYCEKHSNDLLIGKRRGLGLSSIFGCSLPLFYTLTIPNTKVPLTSADKDRVESLLADIIMPSYTCLHPYYRPATIKSDQGELFFGERINQTDIVKGRKQKNVGFGGLMSKIITRPTHLKPKNFEGVRAKYGFLDELFLHPLSNKVRASMRQCFGEGLEKTGWLAMGGSAGDENPKSLEVAETLWLDAEKEELITLFIPGTKGNPGKCKYTDRPFMVNGHSQEDVAREFIERKLDDLSKKTDLTDYRQFKTEMPLTVEDMFAIKNSDVFPPEVMEILKQQKQRILVTKPTIHVGEVEEKEDGNLRFNNNFEEGKTKILKMPDARDADWKYLHVGGIDPIPGNEAGEKGSDFGFVLLNRQNKTPVAIRKERSADVPYLTYQVIKIQKFYHNAEAMLEVNHGGVSLETYRNEGVYKLLADRAQNLDFKYSNKEKRKGFSKVNGPIKIRLHQFLVKYLLEHGDKIWFLDLIDDLFEYSRGKNADLTDALAAALLADADWAKKETKEQNKTAVYQVPTVQNVNGKMVKVYKEIRKNVNEPVSR